MKTDLLRRAQTFMTKAGIDAWVVCDFRGNNPALAPILGRRLHTTRRVILVVPASGQVALYVHAIEEGQFGEEGGAVHAYRTHEDLVGALRPHVRNQRLAIEYSPGGRLPAVSWVDAGTVDLLRALEPSAVESSADLLQAALAVWGASALAAHHEASVAVAAAKDAAFETIRANLAAGTALTEYDVQSLIGERLAEGGFETDHAAIVGTNAHSSDPHYAPVAASSSVIGSGDWVLIDLWARRPGDDNVFADITWVAAAAAPTAQQWQVFDTVRRARDLIVDRVHEAWRLGEPVQGWELDRLARDLITEAGYGERFLHRTGHSLSPGPAVHGLGANLDDVESRDTRVLLPGTGFTIEPGIYLADFGVRLEIDVYVDPDSGPIVTTPVQDDIVLLA